MNQKNKSLYQLLTFGIMTLSAAFLILRAPYGWCFNDEPFIVTLAQRLYLGDYMILDEWHPAQVFGPVLFPFYYVFRLFCPDNTGILLAFRYIYCALWWGTCLIIFHVIKKQINSTPTALYVFVYLVLFSPLDNMTLSYTSVGLMSCLLLSCLMLVSKDIPPQNTAVISATFSFLVVILSLCSPYMAGGYVAVLVLAICKRKKRITVWEDKFYRIVRWSGCCSIFFFIIIILGFVRKEGEGWRTYLYCIKMVFADPEHLNTSILSGLKDCLIRIVRYNFAFSTIIGISIACGLFRKGIRKYRLILFAICVCGYLYAEYCYLNNEVYVKFNQQMIDIALLGLAAFALLEEKPWDLFINFTITGLVYTFLNYLATNTGIYSIGMTLSACGVASIVYIIKLCLEMGKQFSDRKQLRILVTLLCIGIITVQLSSELFSRIVRQYWDEEPAVLTETIQVGAAKGLKTTPERKEEYERQYEDLKRLLDLVKQKQEKRFVSFTASPIIYLDANLKFGTFTAWNFSYKENYMEYLKRYQDVIQHTEESIYYTSKQRDIPDSFPVEHYQKICIDESAIFVALEQPVCLYTISNIRERHLW